MEPEIERHYRALNLEPTASPEDVYQAYRDLVRVWDPQRFANQPHLELMAEGKLKEVIAAYRALSQQVGISDTPAPPEVPSLLFPVPDHIADRNVPKPVLPPQPPVAEVFGQRPEAPPEQVPLQPWEQNRPAGYPKPEPPPEKVVWHAEAPVVQSKPAAETIRAYAAQFGAFLIPVLLVAVGIYFYGSSSNRSARVSQGSAPPATAETEMPSTVTPPPASHHVPRKAAQPVAAQAEAALQLPNGSELMPPRGHKGAGRFRIANRSGQDAVIRVAEQGTPGTPLRLVYVQADTEVPIGGIGTGVYVVNVSLGTLTKAPRNFAATLGPFQFMQIESVDGPQSDDYQLVLKPSR